jgi:hypothetical protein
MKNQTPKPIRKKLSELPPMTEFTYYGKEYRTITWPNRPVHDHQKGDVMNLSTFKLVRMPYGAKVVVK